tara:strand:- start:1220 stop:1924 length:705 start_codon:yes stop_codon:yes gene_type:complete
MYKEIFLSHAWGQDTLGRDNHKRVENLYKLLINKGYTVWFDKTDLIGNIDNSIIKGINNCNIVIICLTENYCNKINHSVYENMPNDNCYKEWNFTLFKQKIIIPLIMEPSMENIFLKNDGVIQMYLNNLMYINFTDDYENDFDILCKTLKKYNIYNKKEKINIKPNNSFDKLKELINLSPSRKKEYTIDSVINDKKFKSFNKYNLIKYLFWKNKPSKKYNIFNNKKKNNHKIQI